MKKIIYILFIVYVVHPCCRYVSAQQLPQHVAAPVDADSLSKAYFDSLDNSPIYLKEVSVVAYKNKTAW